MAGEGIALPAEDEAEVMRVFSAIESQLRPETDVERSLVRRLALMTIRLDRCAVNDAAATSARMLAAGTGFDAGRMAEVDRLMESLDEGAAKNVRLLKQMPEGIDRMVATWLAIKADLACVAEDRWDDARRRMAENLSGRSIADFGVSRVEALARAIRGDFKLLGPGDAADLDDRRRVAWARAQMVELIDVEVAGLLAHRDTLDLATVAKLRALAPGIALFDPTEQGRLARRYEADAERGMYRALRELRRAPGPDRVPVPKPEINAVEQAQADLLASFRGAAASGFLPAPKPEKRRPDPAKCRPMPPSRRDRSHLNPPRDASTIAVGRA